MVEQGFLRSGKYFLLHRASLEEATAIPSCGRLSLDHLNPVWWSPGTGSWPFSQKRISVKKLGCRWLREEVGMAGERGWPHSGLFSLGRSTKCLSSHGDQLSRLLPGLEERLHSVAKLDFGFFKSEGLQNRFADVLFLSCALFFCLFVCPLIFF